MAIAGIQGVTTGVQTDTLINAITTQVGREQPNRSDFLVLN